MTYILWIEISDENNKYVQVEEAVATTWNCKTFVNILVCVLVPMARDNK